MANATETEKGYQGWTNYETWSVALILGNDKKLYDRTRRMVRSAETVYGAADALKDWITNENPLDADAQGGPLAPLIGLYQQLLTGALSEVNWLEVAESFREE